MTRIIILEMTSLLQYTKYFNERISKPVEEAKINTTLDARTRIDKLIHKAERKTSNLGKKDVEWAKTMAKVNSQNNQSNLIFDFT